jgi:hypothetical protein
MVSSVKKTLVNAYTKTPLWLHNGKVASSRLDLARNTDPFGYSWSGAKNATTAQSVAASSE